MALPSSSVNPNSFSIRWIQVSFMLFAFIIPLCYIFIIFLLWVIPLYAKEQRILFTIAEIIRAWSSMEVFVLAVITALIALQQFTRSIIGHHCDLINKIIKRFLPWIFYGGVEVCFDIKATLLPGCWLMFFSVVIYIVVGQVVMGLCHKVIQERDHLYKAYQKRTKKGCGCSTGCMKEYYNIFIEYVIVFFTKCKIINTF
jgi:Paraquat-inducible protein A